MLFGFGNALVASLLASGVLALPQTQNMPTNQGPNNMIQQPYGQTTAQVKSQGVPAKVYNQDENFPLPQISEHGPAYSLLLAKETSPVDQRGVIVAWVYGNPFCTQRQLVSDTIEDFCGRNLTFDRVPKLDENLQTTGEVTQISGYFYGCSDDVSLARSYQGLYWVELVSMHDGVGDQPSSPGGTSGVTTPPSTNPPSSNQMGSPSNNQNTPPPTGGTTKPPTSQQGTGTTAPDTSGTTQNSNSNQNGQNQGNSPDQGGSGTTESAPGTAYKCNNDYESHGCPRSPTTEDTIVTFVSCGQYAYTDKKNEPGTGGNNQQSDTSTQQGTAPPTTPPSTGQQNTQQNTQQQGTQQSNTQQQNTQPPQRRKAFKYLRN